MGIAETVQPRRHRIAAGPAFTLAVAAVLVASCGGPPARDGGRPASVAALGDSITRGYGACDSPGDCPEVSWATGSKGSIDSHARRAGRGTDTHNLAVSGSRVADLESQARRAIEVRADYVTVLIGANDACRPTELDMTPVPRFAADFGRALDALAAGLPQARILVVSVPDLLRLWEVGRTDARVVSTWDRMGICRSMLADAGSTTSAATERRARVRERIADYNRVMAQACARHAHCRSDGGAAFAYRFTLEHVSTSDYWHPSQAGQRALADVTWRSGFWG